METTGKLADALAKAQAEFKAIKKDKTAKVRMKAGGEYSYNYADLSSVIDATKEALSKNGLAIMQPVEFQGERLVLHTKLLHSSGEMQSGTGNGLCPDLRAPLFHVGNSRGGLRR
jgi:hypothetical protein